MVTNIYVMTYSKGFRFKAADLDKFSKGADEIAALLKQGCRIMGLTRGQFSLIDLIYVILRKIGRAEVICVTWSAGIKDANQVKWMSQNKLIENFVIITDHSYSTRQKKYAIALVDLFGQENIRASEIHAKFTLIKNDAWSIVITTSMNLNANKTCESFEINDDAQIYAFYREFVDHIIGEMPEGFTSRSDKVNDCLDRYFITNETIKGWSEI